MTILNKLSGYQRTPHGLEWKILKKMPWMFFSSAMVIGLCTLAAHFMTPDAASLQETAKYLDSVNIIAIAILITSWTILLAVAFSAFIVYLMKGPAYVWDPLNLTDSDKPAN